MATETANEQDSSSASSNTVADSSVWCEDGHNPRLLTEDGECPRCGQGCDVTLTVEEA